MNSVISMCMPTSKGENDYNGSTLSGLNWGQTMKLYNCVMLAY